MCGHRQESSNAEMQKMRRDGIQKGKGEESEQDRDGGMCLEEQ